MKAYDLCKAWINAGEQKDAAYQAEAREEAARRGLSAAQCERIYAEENESAAGFLVGLLALGAVVALASSGAGRGAIQGGAQALAAPETWEWDLINAPDGRIVWVCRQVSDGRFSELERCAAKVKTDAKWPGLGDPFKR